MKNQPSFQFPANYMGKTQLYPSSAAAAAAAVLLLLLFSAAAPAEGAKVKVYNEGYGFFSNHGPFEEETYRSIVVKEGNATIHNQALQVTLDTANPDFDISNAAGRILLRKRFRLWEGNPNSTRARVATFNTSFLINMSPVVGGAAVGEGMAFVIVPEIGGLPTNSSGEFLGLTNSTTDGDPRNKVVAVELDTFKQDLDPDDNHIGIDLHGVRSVAVESLTPLNMTLASSKGRFYNIWIDYDGGSRVIRVYIAEQATKDGATPPKPEAALLSYGLNLTDHVQQDSYFGFAASTGKTVQLNCVLRWNLTVHHFEDGGDGLRIGLGVGIPAAAVLLLGALLLGCYWHKRRMATTNPTLDGALRSLPGTPREFEFKDLKKATNSFDEKNKLGQGGYGEVFKGLLVKENLEIAVKRFSRESIQGQDDFLAELTIINRLRHRHLVKLLGTPKPPFLHRFSRFFQIINLRLIE